MGTLVLAVSIWAFGYVNKLVKQLRSFRRAALKYHNPPKHWLLGTLPKVNIHYLNLSIAEQFFFLIFVRLWAVYRRWDVFTLATNNFLSSEINYILRKQTVIVTSSWTTCILLIQSLLFATKYSAVTTIIYGNAWSRMACDPVVVTINSAGIFVFKKGTVTFTYSFICLILFTPYSGIFYSTMSWTRTHRDHIGEVFYTLKYVKLLQHWHQVGCVLISSLVQYMPIGPRNRLGKPTLWKKSESTN